MKCFWTKAHPFQRTLEQGPAFEKVLGTRHTHLKAMGRGPTPFYRILEQGPPFSKSSWSKPHPFERILLFWNAFGPRPTPFKGPFQCVTLGIVSKGKKPSCLWMLPFGPWVLPFGPRGFPIDVLHLPFAPCILTCGPWMKQHHNFVTLPRANGTGLRKAVPRRRGPCRTTILCSAQRTGALHIHAQACVLTLGHCIRWRVVRREAVRQQIMPNSHSVEVAWP